VKKYKVPKTVGFMIMPNDPPPKLADEPQAKSLPENTALPRQNSVWARKELKPSFDQHEQSVTVGRVGQPYIREGALDHLKIKSRGF